MNRLNCKNPNCGFSYYCFKRRNNADFVPPCEKGKRNQDIRGEKK